jgi:hypothetical protein
LKAAADGWRISYIGGDKFEFVKHNTTDTESPQQFTNNYINKFLV